MSKEQRLDLTQAVIEQIKKDPISFIPTREELEKVIYEREEADKRLKEAGIIVIL